MAEELSDENSTIEVEYIVHKNEWELLDREDEYTLIQKNHSYDRLTNTMKCRQQVINNPDPRNPDDLKDKKAGNEEDGEDWDVFKKEYFQGDGKLIGGFKCYHSPKSVRHDDIVNDATADAIAQRAFYKKGSSRYEVTVQTPVPVPLMSVGGNCTIPGIDYEVNGTPITILGGTYKIKGYNHSVNVSGRQMDHKLTINLYKEAVPTKITTGAGTVLS
jgi:hypothetical protein